MHLGGHTTHTHTCTHTHTHTHFHARFYHTHTHYFYVLLHTFLSRTSLRHTFVAHADPSPSLFSFLHFPSHLYLSFAANWKKLTCGVIRSSNLLFFVFVLAFSFVVFFWFFLFVSYCSWTQKFVVLLLCFGWCFGCATSCGFPWVIWLEPIPPDGSTGTLQTGSCLNYLRRIGIGP